MYHFQSQISIMARGSEMPSCNITPCQWCVYWLLGLSEHLKQGLKINKGPLLGYIDSLHLWLPVGLQSIQFWPPYKVQIVRRFLTLWFWFCLLYTKCTLSICFYPRPVVAFGYCRYLHLCVCVYVSVCPLVLGFSTESRHRLIVDIVNWLITSVNQKFKLLRVHATVLPAVVFPFWRQQSLLGGREHLF